MRIDVIFFVILIAIIFMVSIAELFILGARIEWLLMDIMFAVVTTFLLVLSNIKE